MCGLALAQSFVQASPLERIASLGQEVLSPRISRPMWLLRATPAKCSARSTNRTNSPITKTASSSKDDTARQFLMPGLIGALMAEKKDISTYGSVRTQNTEAHQNPMEC